MSSSDFDRGLIVKTIQGIASIVERIKDVFGWEGFPAALFYQAKYGLRFDLGGELSEDPVRFLQAIDRARVLSEAVFQRSATVSVVVSYHAEARRTSGPAASFKKLSDMGFRAPFDAFDRVATNDADYIKAFGSDLYRYWHAAEIVNEPSQLSILLWACVAREGPVTPKARRLEDIYIVDFERGVAAHVYDDRGMDLIANDEEKLQDVYDRFAGWLLDYDRAEMDVTFQRNER